ncbi:MAG: hypothetical protein ACQET0_06150, partial [Pseudomonadota bacterium]
YPTSTTPELSKKELPGFAGLFLWLGERDRCEARRAQQPERSEGKRRRRAVNPAASRPADLSNQHHARTFTKAVCSCEIVGDATPTYRPAWQAPARALDGRLWFS